MDWFRSWHGAPTDPKWLLIARNAMKRSETHVTPGMVSAVVWALFDHASQAEPRGNVEGFDMETYAVFSGFDEAIIAAIIEELKDKSLIISGALSAWQKRQPKREDNSTDRVREHRNALKRNVTHGNAREEKIREEKIREDKKDSEANASGAAAPSDPAIPEREYFERGRKVLGPKSGAMIANLLKAKGRNVALARAALEQASQKDNPIEYVAAICRGPPMIKPQTAHQQERQTGREILDDIGKFISSSGSQADPRLLRHDPGDGPESLRSGVRGNLIELSPGRAGKSG